MEVILPAAAVLAAAIVVLALLERSRRLRVGGLGFRERMRMRREGTGARALVLDSVICNLGGPRDDLSVDHRIVVEIQRPDAGPERIQLAVRWRNDGGISMVQGANLPVLVSPRFPGRAMIDYRALRREARSAARAQRVEDERRQRSLLDDRD